MTTISGAVMETVLEHVRQTNVLNTYDYVDLISLSHTHENHLQELGNAIIDFCNIHAHKSLQKYDLDQIGYSQLIIHDKETPK